MKMFVKAVLLGLAVFGVACGFVVASPAHPGQSQTTASYRHHHHHHHHHAKGPVVKIKL